MLLWLKVAVVVGMVALEWLCACERNSADGADVPVPAIVRRDGRVPYQLWCHWTVLLLLWDVIPVELVVGGTLHMRKLTFP